MQESEWVPITNVKDFFKIGFTFRQFGSGPIFTVTEVTEKEVKVSWIHERSMVTCTNWWYPHTEQAEKIEYFHPHYKVCKKIKEMEERRKELGYKF